MQEGSRIPGTKARLGEPEKEITESYDRWELLESILNSQPALYRFKYFIEYITLEKIWGLRSSEKSVKRRPPTDYSID